MAKKTIAKITTLILLVATITLLFVGCESYGRKSIGEKADSTAIVESNGGLTVKQGDYIYFINGKSGYSFTSSSQNYFNGKKNENKGAIMRRKLVDGAFSDSVEVIVPKNVMTSYTKGGFYVFGEWIYYVSPTTDADFSGAMLSESELDIMRTKIDGTGTQKITSVKGNNFEYVVTPNSILYKLDAKIMRIDTTVKKGFKVVEVADEVSGWMYFVNDKFTPGTSKTNIEAVYVKASEDETSRASEVFTVNGDGSTTKIIDAKTYTDNPASVDNVEKVFAIAIKYAFVANDNFVIYYEKSHYRGGTATTTGLYAYVLDGNAVDATKENHLSLTVKTSIIPISESSYYYMDGNKLRICKGMNNDEELADFKSTVVIKYIVTENGKDYVYYTKDSSLIRKAITGGNADVLVSTSAFASDWLGDEKIGNMWFYTNSSDYTCTYYIDLTTYNPSDAEALKNAIMGKLSVSDQKLKDEAAAEKNAV